MSKWKKIILTIQVFAPILIKGICSLWKEIMEAYEDANIKQLNLAGEIANKLMEEK